MTEARARFDQRLAALGPGHPRAGARRGALPAPPARGRPDAPDRRRPARPAHDRRASATCGRPRAASPRGIDPVAAARRRCPTPRRWRSSRVPPAHAALGARRQPDALQARLRQGRPALPALRAGAPIRARGQGDDNRTTYWCPAMPDVTLRRVGHKGADHIAPGNTPASFDAALAARVDMIEFDVLPRDPDAPTRPARARARLRARARRTRSTLEEGLAHLAARAFADVELDVDLKLPGLRAARRRRRCASTASSSARSSRRCSCAASWRCARSSRGCGSAGRSRGCDATTRRRAVRGCPAFGLLVRVRRAAARRSPPGTCARGAATR